MLELGRARVEVDGGDIGEPVVLKLDHPEVAQGRQRGRQGPAELVVLKLYGRMVRCRPVSGGVYL